MVGMGLHCFYSYTLERLNQLISGTINTTYQIVLARYSQLGGAVNQVWRLTRLGLSQP